MYIDIEISFSAEDSRVKTREESQNIYADM